MCECMMFPDNVEEFMDSYKIVDTEQVYTNGAEMVPIFRMKQWFEHRPERKTGRWMATEADEPCFYRCSECGRLIDERENFCPNCGARMEGEG